MTTKFRIVLAAAVGTLCSGSATAQSPWLGTGPIYYNGGSVGIGTTGPNRSLHLYGQNSAIAIQDSSSGGHEYVLTNYNTGDGSMGLYDQTSLVFRWLVNASGNVGIGTVSPQYPLSVNGTVQAKEVLVNTGWSDYVFDPGYRLAPLPEVSAYVSENHHLPGIPSSAEAAEKGIPLGEMQSKLLAKIEELTHMIQAEKENRELKERLRRVEEKMSEPRR